VAKSRWVTRAVAAGVLCGESLEHPEAARSNPATPAGSATRLDTWRTRFQSAVQAAFLSQAGTASVGPGPSLCASRSFTLSQHHRDGSPAHGRAVAHRGGHP